MKNPETVLIRAETPGQEFEVHHPLNADSQIWMRPLGRLTGLQRVGVTLARVPPGKESFIYHSHQHEEEFVYILSGRGIAEIDDAEFEVGPGDFMGFPAPSVAHHLRNPFDADLVYLMGGEHLEMEIADFPRLNKRLIRDGAEVSIVDRAAIEPLFK
jgi:uncharacterized cupin superfamily protein